MAKHFKEELTPSENVTVQGGKHVARASSSGTDAAPRPRHPRARLIVPLAVLACAAAVYGAGWAWYAGHALPGTTLDGQDISGKDSAQIAAEAPRLVRSFAVSAKDADGQTAYAVSGDQIGLSCDGHALADAVLEAQKPYAWPARLLESVAGAAKTPTAAALPVSFDSQKLQEAVDAAVKAWNADGATAPKDASISYDKASHAFVVAPEQPGTELVADACAASTADAFRALAPSFTLQGQDLVQPKTTKDDPRLAQAAHEADKLLGAKIAVTLDGRTVVSPDDDVVADWVVLDQDFVPSITKSSIAQWARARYDTVGTARHFKDWDGRERTVVCSTDPESASTYGQKVDADAFADKALKAVQNKESATIDLPLLQRADAFTEAGAQDWGPRYIDVDIANQKATLVDHGSVLWQSDTVTGNVAAGNSTPEGVYTITNKYHSIPLQGEDGGQNFVYDWMGFIRSVWGLHDATWRDAFGGDIYKTNGSHGCVNLPREKADELYDLVHVGDVVVVHE